MQRQRLTHWATGPSPVKSLSGGLFLAVRGHGPLLGHVMLGLVGLLSGNVSLSWKKNENSKSFVENNFFHELSNELCQAIWEPVLGPCWETFRLSFVLGWLLAHVGPIMLGKCLAKLGLCWPFG